jgi:predicted MFS family arabinose efflux permease
VTAFLANQAGWRAAFLAPGLICTVLGLWWMRQPAPEEAAKGAKQAFPEIPPHLVCRAVVVLLLLAVVSGLVFNAFRLLLPKLMEERVGGDPHLLPLVGLAACLATLCGAISQFTVGRMIDRTTLNRAAGGGGGRGGYLRPGNRERDNDRAVHLAGVADTNVLDTFLCRLPRRRRCRPARRMAD